MSFDQWLLLIGGLLLGIALVHPVVKRLPLTTTIIYLLVGVALSPFWLNVLSVDPFRDLDWLHHGAELAVLISLFGVGMKLRLTLSHVSLRPALSLAVGSMVITVGLVAAAGYWIMELPIGAAVLLGAVLAPTDPVLASDVQLRHAADRDRIRLTLSAEAGLNDGTAFPFVLLGLGLLGVPEHHFEFVRWLTRDVLWAGFGGLAIGSVSGYAVGRLALSLQRKRASGVAFREYLVLGLVGVSYGLAVALHTYGFLAVFAAGVGLRAVERRSSTENKIEESVVKGEAGTSQVRQNDPRAAVYMAGALQSTNEQLEHILEVAMVLLVGAALSQVGISKEALWLAPLLFLVIRPVACMPVLLVHRFTWSEAGAVAWFGIRGIGSLYYVMYSIAEGLPRELAGRLVSLTLTMIALSILVHGISVTPLLDVYYRRKQPR